MLKSLNPKYPGGKSGLRGPARRAATPGGARTWPAGVADPGQRGRRGNGLRIDQAMQDGRLAAASARSKAGPNCSLLSTRSPWPPKARA